MQRLIIFLFISFSACIPSGQDSLIGEWKPAKVIVYNAFSNTTSVLFDKDNQEIAKRKLLNEYISRSETDSDVIDTEREIFKNRLDNDFLRFDSARLTFKKDSTIYIENYGLIIPTAVPGWSFGEKLNGKWTQNAQRLNLLIREKTANYPFFYKIKKQTSDSLILAMTTQDFEQEYMTLEFVRH